MPRKVLLDALAAHSDTRLVTIVGPAASGKTTLARDWLREDGRPFAWYPLVKSDNEPDTFLRRCRAELTRLTGGCIEHNGIASDPAAMLCSRPLPPDSACLVLDDYHVITNPEVHDLLLDLVSRTGPGVRVVALSRSSMPFPLSKLRLEGLVAEIGPDALKLNLHETERLLSDIFLIELSPGQLYEVSRIMAGWLGGLKFFGLSAKDKDMQKSFGVALKEACRIAEDYLVDQVIDPLPPPVKEFLYATSLFGQFDVDLCRAATGFEDSDLIIESLRRSLTFFLVSEYTNGTYRYHPLFSSAVARGLDGPKRASQREILTRAAQWCSEKGDAAGALRHAFASGDMAFAADTLEALVEVLYRRGQFSLFRKYFSRLPHNELFRHPLLWLQECRFRIESIQLAEVPLIVAEVGTRARLIERYQGKQERLCRDLLQLFRYLPDWYTPGNVREDTFNDFIRHISPDNIVLSGIVALSRPLSYLLQGQLGPAVAALNEAAAQVFASGDLLAAMIWFRSMITAERLQGHLSRCESILNDAALFIKRHGSEARQVEFVLYLPEAWVHYFRNEVSEALDYALAAVKNAEQTGFLYEIVDGSFLVSLISMATGDVARAGRSMRRMQKAAAATGSPGIVALTDAYLARFSVIHGDLEWATQWAEKRRFGYDGEEPFSFRFVPECMAQSQLHYARGQYSKAAQLLEMLRGRCKEHGMMEGLLEADLLYTGVLYALGDLTTARAVMEEAASFAQAEGYVRLFINRSPLISPVLVRMTGKRGKGARSPYLSVIAKACGVQMRPDGPRCNEETGEGLLTSREVEILRLIAAGCRNKEIAEKAFISLDTVRTHTSHIFQKLEVKTRVQAIRKAESLGIIGSPEPVDRTSNPRMV